MAASKKDVQYGKMIRLDALTIRRVDRVLDELNRRSREGELVGGVTLPEVARTALLRALLEPGLVDYEKRFKLPKLEKDDGNGEE